MPIMKHYLSITEDDLHGLVKRQESEIVVQDFKRDAPALASPSDKHEFLADVTSFANTAGGHIYYGIDEDKGQAVSVAGVQPPDVDALKTDGEHNTNGHRTIGSRQHRCCSAGQQECGHRHPHP